MKAIKWIACSLGAISSEDMVRIDNAIRDSLNNKISIVSASHNNIAQRDILPLRDKKIKQINDKNISGYIEKSSIAKILENIEQELIFGYINPMVKLPEDLKDFSNSIFYLSLESQVDYKLSLYWAIFNAWGLIHTIGIGPLNFCLALERGHKLLIDHSEIIGQNGELDISSGGARRFITNNLPNSGLQFTLITRLYDETGYGNFWLDSYFENIKKYKSFKLSDTAKRNLKELNKKNLKKIKRAFQKHFVSPNISGAHYFICNIRNRGIENALGNSYFILIALIKLVDRNPVLLIIDPYKGSMTDDVKDFVLYLYSNFINTKLPLYKDVHTRRLCIVNKGESVHTTSNKSDKDSESDDSDLEGPKNLNITINSPGLSNLPSPPLSTSSTASSSSSTASSAVMSPIDLSHKSKKGSGNLSMPSPKEESKEVKKES